MKQMNSKEQSHVISTSKFHLSLFDFFQYKNFDFYTKGHGNANCVEYNENNDF